MKSIKSYHWTKGGTVITNFDRKDLKRYNKAINLYGCKDIVVSRYPMLEPYAKNAYSLHNINVKVKDLSDFWTIFKYC